MYSIYLAGYISGKKLNECLKWRKDLRLHYKALDWPIIWLDPLNGETFKDIDTEGLKCSIPGKSLVHRDYASVCQANLLVVNLDTFGEIRPLTGTIYELAWAWEQHKPVIIITTERNYKEHPFIKDTASIIVSNLEELIQKKYINYFYKGTVSAKYKND